MLADVRRHRSIEPYSDGARLRVTSHADRVSVSPFYIGYRPSLGLPPSPARQFHDRSRSADWTGGMGHWSLDAFQSPSSAYWSPTVTADWSPFLLTCALSRRACPPGIEVRQYWDITGFTPSLVVTWLQIVSRIPD